MSIGKIRTSLMAHSKIFFLNSSFMCYNLSLKKIILHLVMNNSMLIKVSIAMVLAVIAGYFTGPDKAIFGVTYLQIFSLIGQLFLNALTLVVVPLVASSIISGTAKMGAEKSFGALGLKTILLFLGTTTAAVIVGWFFVMTIYPGEGSYAMLEQFLGAGGKAIPIEASQIHGFQKIEEIFYKLIPSNILAVASQGQMLGLIFFSLLFGFFIPRIEPLPRDTLFNFWVGLFQIMMKMTHLVMKALPIGVFGLVAKVVATTGFDSIRPIGYFALTIFIALVVYSIVVLPIFLFVVGGIKPIRHYKAVMPALFAAFSTSSNAATLPISIECVEKRAGVSNRICSFSLPLASSLNASGSALYVCVSSLFICQVYGLDFSYGVQLLIVLMAVMTSLGMAGIPSGSLVAVILVLHTAGLSSEGIVLIMATERILDMIRTVVNVLSNTVCTVLLAKLEGEEHVLAG